MATSTQKIRSSHDDPVVIDNGPFRLDLRGAKKSARGKRADGEVAHREFTFFSQLIVTVIKGNDFDPPEVIRLTRTPPLVFHLAKGGTRGKVTFKWKQSGDPNEPYGNALVVDSDVELASDGKGRLKARNGDLQVVKIQQGGKDIWTRSGLDGTLLMVLIPETEPRHH
jgi:hypothetical protein